jgi:hypothetical protein
MRKESVCMRNARKHLVWILGLALALGASGVASAASVQHLEASINKKKLPKKQRKGVKFSFHVFDVGASGLPPAPTLPSQAKSLDLKLGKGFAFDTKGVPECNQNDPAIQSGSTAAALAACPDSVVGQGDAQVVCNPPLPSVPAVITAFNGVPEGGNPVLIEQAVSTLATVPIIAEIRGRTIHADLDQLAAGVCALNDFSTVVGKGKYVSARCKKKNKGLEVTSDWTYFNGPDLHVDNETPIKCKPKG